MTNAELVRKWERSRDEFVELSKSEFDELCRAEQFEAGPMRTEHSGFKREYGPYSPERWAFGKLSNGRLVFVKIQPL